MNAIKHQRKLLSIILALAMIFGIFSIMQMPMSVSAAIGDTFSDGGYTYQVVDDIIDNTVALSSVGDNAVNVVVPEKVNYNGKDFKVTSISVNAFSASLNKIESLDLSNSVIETFPAKCLARSTSLQSVIFPEKNDKFDLKDSTAAFALCTKLSEVTFPASVKNIPTSLFNGCTSLKTVNILGDDVNFGLTVFIDCTALTDIYFYGNGNVTFSFNSFLNASTNITFHAYEGSSVLEWAASQTGVNYKTEIMEPPTTSETEPTTETTPTDPDTSIFKWEKINDGKEIQINGFKDTYKPTSTLNIDSEINGLPVTRIGANAFEEIFTITTITIPSSIQVINNRAFYGLEGLKTVTFEDESSIIRIGDEAFAQRLTAQTNLLNEISLPESLKSLGYRVFAGRKSLLNVYIYSKDVVFGGASGTELFVYQNQGENEIVNHPSTLKIYGHGNSTAEEYALQEGITFSYLDLDKTALQEAYDKASKIDGSLYTATSYSNLVSAIAQAIRVLRNSGATQVEVNASLAALNEAMDNLVLKDQPGTTANPEPTTVKPEPTTADPEPTTASVSTDPTESTPAPVFEEFILGDADYNGIVNIKDVTYIQLHLAKLLNKSVNTIYLNYCDVDGDGEVTIKDVTQIQLWLAKFKVEYKIGELVQREVTPGSNPPATVPGPTTSTDPTTVSDPTGSPEPTTAPVPGDAIRFYVPNAVSWLTDLGGSMWLYNDDTQEFERMLHDEEEDYFYLDIPKDWSNLSIYRTPYETEENQFDITDKRDPDKNPEGTILNYWENLGPRGENDCYYITADKKGYYTMYESTKGGPVEFMRTIYFDNSKTQWSMVYIYGWNFGLHEDAVAMEQVPGTNLWSYTFVTPDLPKNGVEGFLFVSEHGIKDVESSWSNAKQTGDLATEAGKDLFVPSGSGNKISGTWEVYTPAE